MLFNSLFLIRKVLPIPNFVVRALQNVE